MYEVFFIIKDNIVKVFIEPFSGGDIGPLLRRNS